MENVIIDWNALRKIHTRYEELNEANIMLKEFSVDLREQLADIDTEQIKNQMNIDQSPGKDQDQQMLKTIINSCILETQNLMNEVIDLQQVRNQLYAQFDSEVP